MCALFSFYFVFDFQDDYTEFEANLLKELDNKRINVLENKRSDLKNVKIL